MEDIVSHDGHGHPLSVNPRLHREVSGGVAFWTDPAQAREGILVAFSERTGGTSAPPFASLNLAGHVGDDPGAVDVNRLRFLEAVGVGDLASRLVTAEQVHGAHAHEVVVADAGRGALLTAGEPPIPSTDALLTTGAGIPLMLLFADCVPVALVAPGRRGAGVVHAGWRGALASLPGAAVEALAQRTSVSAGEIVAYVGAHVRACHYSVDDALLSQFVNAFGTVARAESGGLDLAAVVTESLTRSGVDPCNIARLEACTAEATDRFFSYRAEQGVTGRHGALVCILP